MLTVPRQAACSWEQEMVTGDSSITGYALASSWAMTHATIVSVASGKWSPCCSKLPTGSSATDASRSASSFAVAMVIRSINARPPRALRGRVQQASDPVA
jgi:hypothetical protein